jgi:hypothetical protein
MGELALVGQGHLGEGAAVDLEYGVVAKAVFPAPFQGDHPLDLARGHHLGAVGKDQGDHRVEDRPTIGDPFQLFE